MQTKSYMRVALQSKRCPATVGLARRCCGGADGTHVDQSLNVLLAYIASPVSIDTRKDPFSIGNDGSNSIRLICDTRALQRGLSPLTDRQEKNMLW